MRFPSFATMFPPNSSTTLSIDDDVSPIVLTQTETILYFVCLSQGVPINVLVSVVIARNKRLHNPRNTFWFGITMLNLLTMFMSLLKMLAAHASANFCLVFTFTTGKPYTILLFMLLLATLDRYVAITHPLYHRKHVTVQRVVIVQVACFTLVFALLSLPVLFGWVPFRCGFSKTLAKWTIFLRSILVTLCISAQIKVYLTTRKYLRQAHVEVEVSVLQNITDVQRQHRLMNRQLSESLPPAMESSATSLSDDPQRNHSSLARNATFFVHRRNKSVSKLELEASLTLIVGVLSLCFMTAPMFIVHFTLAVCQHLEGECSELSLAVPYVRQAALIHAVYGPLIYIIRSREFSAAIRRMLRPKLQSSADFI